MSVVSGDNRVVMDGVVTRVDLLVLLVVFEDNLTVEGGLALVFRVVFGSWRESVDTCFFV
jgi:hypothetical protein